MEEKVAVVLCLSLAWVWQFPIELEAKITTLDVNCMMEDFFMSQLVKIEMQKGDNSRPYNIEMCFFMTSELFQIYVIYIGP